MSRVGYPGHGASIPNLQLKLQQEIQQRKRRERKVLGLLETVGSRKGEKGSATETEIVAAIFGAKLPTTVLDHLRPQMREILMKMAREKRMGFRLRGGEKHWFAYSTPSTSTLPSVSTESFNSAQI